MAPVPTRDLLPVAIGDVVGGKYRVERLIAQGGMGSVVAATHVSLLQRVAIKFMHGDVDQSARARFLREARAAAMLGGEHVARVVDFGEVASSTPYIVMELLEGMDLEQRLTDSPLAPRDALEIIRQTALGLEEAHAKGIIHRDVKPRNIFLVRLPDGRIHVKVLDFGVTKVMDPSLVVAEDLTGTSASLGTPRYMSPEQMTASRDVDARADVWALGVCLYRCLSGVFPFGGATAMEIGAAVLAGEPAPLETLCPHAPPEVVAIVRRCLERNPAGRYRDAGELAAALATALDRASLDDLPPLRPTPPGLVGGAEGTTLAATMDDPALGVAPRTAASSSRARLAIAAVALAVIVSATLSVGLLSRRGKAPATKAVATSESAVPTATSDSTDVEPPIAPVDPLPVASTEDPATTAPPRTSTARPRRTKVAPPAPFKPPDHR